MIQVYLAATRPVKGLQEASFYSANEVLEEIALKAAASIPGL